MSLFLDRTTLVADIEYQVTEYRKYYSPTYNFYAFLIKIINSGNTNYMYTNEGVIFDRLISGNNAPFSIKRTTIDNGTGLNEDVIIIVGDNDWITLA